MTDPTAEVGSRIANRMLGQERWAREALARHAGRTFRVTVGPVASQFAIGADGSISPAPVGAGVPDLELVVSGWNVPALLTDPARWSQLVAATGDPSLATTLQDLAQTLPWFVERAFASALGPIAGQRVADTGRALLAFPLYASARFAENVGSYARDEALLLAPAVDVREFGEQVAAMAVRVDELALRIERVATSISTSGPKPVEQQLAAGAGTSA